MLRLRVRERVAMLAALASLSAPLLVAQQPAVGGGAQPGAQLATEGTSAVSGVVTDATTNQPLAGVMVYLGFQGRVPFVQQSFSASLTPADLAGITPEMIASGRAGAVPDPPSALDVAGASRLVVGAYLVPTPVNGQPRAYVPLFYPAAVRLADASSIELKAADERGGIDISLRAATTSSISGTVTGPPDALTGLVLRLMPDGLEDLGAGSEVATATIGSDGRFSFLNVPIGSYTLDVRRTVSELQYRTPLATLALPIPTTPGAPGRGGGSGSVSSGPYGANYSLQTTRGSGAYFARMKVAVAARPVTDLTVALQRAGTMRGRFVLENGADPDFSNLPAPPIYAEPADGNLGLGMPTSTRPTPTTFEIQGLPAGKFLLRFLSVGNYSVAAVTSNGEDHRYRPFDGSAGADFDVIVTLVDKRIDLSGSVADANGAPVKNAVVLAFPVERELWTNYGLSPARLKGSPTTSSGTYRFQSLPAGEYYLIGVPPEQAEAWQDPAKLAQLASRATRMTLAWGDVKTQNVTVVKLP
jgi:hypothetical protein